MFHFFILVVRAAEWLRLLRLLSCRGYNPGGSCGSNGRRRYMGVGIIRSNKSVNGLR